LTQEVSENKAVAVIGAGPAGLYAAGELAANGVSVAVLNRDIKPGGLAEYGIYPTKHKMKEGLRRQFRKVLASPLIHYFGNLTVGTGGDLSLDDLQALGFDALLVTVGAQGTKWLGLPGEDLQGVYHAKDLVYHYNRLPPFSQREYPIGERVVLIGVGNVMMDITHWIIRDLKVPEVTAIARRGPAEVKFTKKEMENVGANLDVEALQAELRRATPLMESLGQDVQAAADFILSGVEGALEPVSEGRFRLQFLVSPRRILGDSEGKVTGLEVEETTLEPRKGGGTRAVGTGVTRVLEADTVIFCIGDRVDQTLGLPLDKWQEFAKNPEPHFSIEDLSYEAYDPEKGSWVEGVFLAGWAREASSGLVGTARKDGTNGARAVLEYLETVISDGEMPQEVLTALKARLQELDKPIITKDDWQRLEQVEASKAEELGLEEFKFASNQEMLEAIEQSRHQLPT